MALLPKVKLFVTSCKEINTIMKQDNKEGHQWHYYDDLPHARKFTTCRKKGLYYTSCAHGVMFGLLYKNAIPLGADRWYGDHDTIRFTTDEGKEMFPKTFKTFHIGGKKTVKECIKAGLIRPGDIITYYDMTHTNAYIGSNKSFDAGHAYCRESGEGAKFIKWIGALAHANERVAYVVRVRESYADELAHPDTVVKGKLKVTKNTALRKLPMSDAEKLLPSLVSAGTKMYVCDEILNEKGNKWYYVKYNGQYGYIYSAKVKLL